MREISSSEQAAVPGGVMVSDRNGNTLFAGIGPSGSILIGGQNANGEYLAGVLSAPNDHTLTVNWSDGLTLNIPLTWDQNGSPIPLDFDFQIDQLSHN